jgi:hypothetical protein
MLAVDQIFANSSDPLSETIFDGACGSGILLTTPYRRLIAFSEARAGRQLRFRQRAELLKRHIFGGDVNFMARRVTAFSLYLSLLEGLDPADIVEAQELEDTKLPSDEPDLRRGCRRLFPRRTCLQYSALFINHIKPTMGGTRRRVPHFCR